MNKPEAFAPESSSVSNNHPTPDAEPGYADVAGFNTGDAAAFNSGNSSENASHPAIHLPSLQSLEIAEYSDFDGFEVTLEFIDHYIDYDGIPLETHCRFTVLNSLTLPAALVGTLQRILRKFAPIALHDFTTEQKPDGTYDASTVEKMHADISRLTWELYATELCLERLRRDSIASEPSPSSDNPRIFFADEPRPAIWQILSRDQQHAIEAFAFGGLEAGDRLSDEDIAVELAHDTAAGWHDTHPIVRVVIDGNEWFIEFEDRHADAGNETEDSPYGGEGIETEDGSLAVTREQQRREIFKRLADWMERIETHGYSHCDSDPYYHRNVEILGYTLRWLKGEVI